MIQFSVFLLEESWSHGTLALIWWICYTGFTLPNTAGVKCLSKFSLCFVL